jgi:hypothetical protein
MYGCQLRRDQNGRWNIIEADDGEVLGNAELMGQSSFDHPDGQTVARGQDRVGRGPLSKMPSAAVLPLSSSESIAVGLHSSLHPPA